MISPSDSELLKAISALGGSVLVVGDLMLDVFAYGSVSRISPEAPIPVMNMSHEAQMLGGAGNVARNIASLEGRAFLVSPIGADDRGDIVERLVEEAGRISGSLIRCPNRQTSTKRRFVVAGQQMLRVDQEDTFCLSAIHEELLTQKVLVALKDASAIILSDYRKGALSDGTVRRIIEAGRASGKPVIIDPKQRNMECYKGAACITPNAAELALATSLPTDTDEDIVVAAQALLAATGADYILATRSEKGMTLVPREGDALHMPANKHEVFDVSGAGDTVVGTLALAVGSGIRWPVAAALANAAAGVVVTKQGTATCSIDELELEISEKVLGLGAKLQGIPEASRIARQWRRLGLRVGFANGCFDLLHPGHISLLQRSREGCDRLIVGLNSDASVRRLKGKTRPIQSQAARAAVLAALGSVDMVVVFEDDTPIELIKSIRPSVLIKGSDYRIDQVVGADLVIADGGEVKLIELVQGESTTNIVRRMG